jgi:hypothetical protein
MSAAPLSGKSCRECRGLDAGSRRGRLRSLAQIPQALNIMAVAPASPTSLALLVFSFPRRLLLVGGFACACLTPAPRTELQAQGITTGAIRGTVRMADSTESEGATVLVRSTATGQIVEALVRREQFVVQGLEPGGPYSVTVRRIGAVARRYDGIVLALGEPLALDVVLEPAPVQLDSMVVTPSPALLSCCDGGTATTLPDSLIHRLPSLNRNVYDFLRLVPQISSRIGFAPGGISGGGVGFRVNGFLTNGVPEQSLGGGQPPEFAGGRSLPFEAVREYRVLLAPFDVRYGDFAGALVNTVTRSGTNRFEGSAFGQARNDALARGGELAVLPYDRWQLGASVAGPIARDRAHFLLAIELQRTESPMIGPFLGQPEGSLPRLPVRGEEIARLEAILRDSYGLVAGSGGPVENRSRIGNLFARVDLGLPGWNSRAVAWLNYSEARSLAFSRVDSFPLSSYALDQSLRPATLALQLHTALRRPGGGENELTLAHRRIPFGGNPAVRQPLIQVLLADSTGHAIPVLTGTPAVGQGRILRQWQLLLRDNFTLPLGRAHVATVGLEAEWFRIGPQGLPNGYGTWSFTSLDSLEAGLADRYTVARDFGAAEMPLPGLQLGAYAGDLWQVGRRLSLTAGLRTDRLALTRRAPYNPLIDSLFGRRTDERLHRTLQLSPRLGFTWDPSGTGRQQLRGGLGIFTGRPPLAWFQTALQNSGLGSGILRCGTQPQQGDRGLPPVFVDPDPLAPPLACGGGEGLTGAASDVDLVDPSLRMARTLRAVLGYERRLPGGLVGTVEGLVTRNLSDFIFVNLNLEGPQGTDPRGRVLYGSIDSMGRGLPALVTPTPQNVFELRNVSRGSAVQIAGSVARRFDHGMALTASYTWSRIRDVQTPLRVNTGGLVNWVLRAVSGRHDDLTPGISLNDVPHRVTLAGTWRAPWRRWLTEVSLLYVGESGSPFTWRVGPGDRRGQGDLNADGGLNDPVYVPRSAFDSSEIVFAGVAAEGDNSPAAQQARVRAQQGALERFVGRSGCLRRQRGRILERNSCREPWAHTTAASLRQTLPIGGRVLEAQLDVLNLLNLVDGDWGLRRTTTASQMLLQHVGQVVGPSGRPEPVFRFDEATARFVTNRAESAFQLQFGMRYRF